MKQLRIRRQVAALTLLPLEPVLRALRILLEPREVAHASRALRSRLDGDAISRRGHHQPSADSQTLHPPTGMEFAPRS